MTQLQCQLASCETEAATTAEHPEYGEIHVCETCANLWGDC